MLTIEHLTKVYKNGKKAVDDISLTIEAGDIYGFIGQNGAGKSTTIKSIVGVQDFDSGKIEIDGHDVKKEPIACKQITAYIPDNPDLYEHLTGIAYLNFIADIFRVSEQERKEGIEKYAAALEITDALPDVISSYSHGMKQKLALVSAFLHSPRLLVLDEPFVGLDPRASIILREFMHELCSRGSAIFFSTHVLEVAEKLCNKVAIIKDGKLLCSGSMEQLTADKSLEDLFMEGLEN